MSEGQAWVPDGDPCPKHPAETSRLVWIQGLGFFSQCDLCRRDFLAWRWANMHEKSDLPSPPKGEKPQLNLIGES